MSTGFVSLSCVPASSLFGSVIDMHPGRDQDSHSTGRRMYLPVGFAFGLTTATTVFVRESLHTCHAWTL